MFDISKEYATYADLLQDRVQTHVFFLICFLLFFIGLTVFLVWWVKSTKKEEELTDSPKERRHNKRENIEIGVISAFIFLFILGGSVQTVCELSDCLYDKNHNAYVVVDGDFTVEKEEYGFGRARDEVYTLIYQQDGEKVEVDLVTKYCDIAEGVYTDKILVFSSRSQVLLDVVEKER